MYLPIYSPNLNPIEEAFSVIKAWLRLNCNYILEKTERLECDSYTLIWEAVFEVITPEKIVRWYRHSEYLA